MRFPNVLVISNECFSKTSSNGRTLGSFFADWHEEHLAQFFISGRPDPEFCKNYFQVSDQQALSSFLRKGDVGGRVDATKLSPVPSNSSTQKKTKRNAMTMLIRELVWKTGRWLASGYWKWVAEFKPQIVLLQAGDCAFMFELACKTAQKAGAKLVIYNTEGYYFKEFDYFKGKGISHVVYPLFRSKLRAAIKKGYHQANYAIFNCEALCQDYCKEFDIPAAVIYTATDLLNVNPDKEYKEKFIVTYAGNLGVGRPQSLVDIANALQKINPVFYLDVYGTIPDKQTQILFDGCNGIRFRGRIPYEEVKQVIRSSDLLVHVESFDPFYLEDLKYAFSTKIADCLASNRCFLMYAPVSFAETKYLLDNNAAYVATSQSELLESLRLLTEEPEMRSKYCVNALELTKKNHDRGASVAAFQSILCDLV